MYKKILTFRKVQKDENLTKTWNLPSDLGIAFSFLTKNSF